MHKFLCILITVASVIPLAAYASPALKQGLTKLSAEPNIRRNNSPVQTFFIKTMPKDNDWQWKVNWPETRWLLWIEKASDHTLQTSPLLVTKQFDLDNAVVEHPSDVGSSTYLVDERWAQAQIKLAIEGEVFQIKLPTGSP